MVTGPSTVRASMSSTDARYARDNPACAISPTSITAASTRETTTNTNAADTPRLNASGASASAIASTTRPVATISTAGSAPPSTTHTARASVRRRSARHNTDSINTGSAALSRPRTSPGPHRRIGHAGRRSVPTANVSDEPCRARSVFHAVPDQTCGMAETPDNQRSHASSLPTITRGHQFVRRDRMWLLYVTEAWRASRLPSAPWPHSGVVVCAVAGTPTVDQ